MINLRLCNEKDCDILFYWVNDSVVRSNAFNKNRILYKNHCEWFNNSLKSNKRKIFIAVDEKKLIGMIRIDIDDSGRSAVISYLVDSKCRGFSFGYWMINELVSIIKKDYKDIDKLIGLVKYDNYASRRTFEKCGYIEVEEEGFVRYTLELT